MPGISYDEQGSLASYFGVTFLAVLLLPFTWAVLKPAKRDPLEPQCHCKACQSHFAALSRQRAADHRKRFVRRLVPLMLGWVFFAYLCYVIANAPRGAGGTVYNPFEILGLSSQSTEKQIKKHYKKLSLQFHPDKIKLSANQSKEDAESHYVDLTKAYKALTDEVTRENLAKYGNPDGPQQREDKIAIPQWVVEGRNNIWVLGAYGLVLGGGIPFVVGRWWFSTRRLTRDGILNGTAEIFFHRLSSDIDFPSLVALLASALELHAICGSKKKAGKKERKDRLAKLEELEKAVEAKLEERGVRADPVMRKESKVEAGSLVARRARALLWAQLLRIDLVDEDLKTEQRAVLLASPLLLKGMLNIVTAHNWLATSLLILNLQPALVQGVTVGSSPLAQLPGVSLEKAEEVSIVQAAEGKRWLEKWVKKDGEKDGELSEARDAAKTWPRLEVLKAEFKVTGETTVSPSSIVNLNLRLRYVYPSHSLTRKSLVRAMENGSAREATVDSVAQVEDAVEKVDGEGEKGTVQDVKEKIVEKVAEIGRKGKVVDEDEDEDTEGGGEKKKEWKKNGYAHAPRWPAPKKPHFHLLLGDTKLDKVIVHPVRIGDVPMPSADGTPSDPREYSLTFQAPPQANLYSFVAFLCSDTFVGADADRPLMMKVEDPPPEAELSDDDEDISDPEEDTLAGQMAMMRGGKVKASGVHDMGGHDSSDEDEEEYDESSSSSDEDGPKRPAAGGRAGGTAGKAGVRDRRAGKAINEDTSSEED